MEIKSSTGSSLVLEAQYRTASAAPDYLIASLRGPVNAVVRAFVYDYAASLGQLFQSVAQDWPRCLATDETWSSEEKELQLLISGRKTGEVVIQVTLQGEGEFCPWSASACIVTHVGHMETLAKEYDTMLRSTDRRVVD